MKLTKTHYVCIIACVAVVVVNLLVQTESPEPQAMTASVSTASGR